MSDTFTTDPVLDPEDQTPDAPATTTPRDLEGDLKTVLDGLITGSMSLPDGKKATPHVLAGMIAAIRGGDKNDRPSSGAVAAALTRWERVGYITLAGQPTSFEDYTDAGRDEGLAALKRKYRASLSAAKKAVAAAAAPQPEPEPTPAPEPEVTVTPEVAQDATDPEVPAVAPFIEDVTVTAVPEVEAPPVIVPVIDDRPPF